MRVRWETNVGWYVVSVIYSNDHTHPTSHVAETSFYANFKVLLPICLSLLVLLGLIAVVLIIRKRSKCDQRPRTPVGARD